MVHVVKESMDLIQQPFVRSRALLFLQVGHRALLYQLAPVAQPSLDTELRVQVGGPLASGRCGRRAPGMLAGKH